MRVSPNTSRGWMENEIVRIYHWLRLFEDSRKWRGRESSLFVHRFVIRRGARYCILWPDSQLSSTFTSVYMRTTSRSTSTLRRNLHLLKRLQRVRLIKFNGHKRHFCVSRNFHASPSIGFISCFAIVSLNMMVVLSLVSFLRESFRLYGCTCLIFRQTNHLRWLMNVKLLNHLTTKQ